MALRYLYALFLLVGPILGANDSEKERELQAEKELLACQQAYEEYAPIYYALLDKFVREAMMQYDLTPGSIYNSLHEKIEEVGAGFFSHRRATIAEARALELALIERLAEMINTNEKIRPYLVEYPLNVNHIYVSIGFLPEWLLHTHVAHIGVKDRDHIYLTYSARDPFTDLYVDSHPDEPYEESLKLNEKSHIQDLTQHQETDLEKALDQVLPAFQEAIRQEYKVESWAMGVKADKQVEEIGAHLIVRKHATQEEAREMMVPIVQKLLKALNDNPSLTPFLADYPFPSKRLKISLGFRTDRYTDYFDGSMESVKLVGDELIYYKQSPYVNGELPPVIEILEHAKEPYHEALQKYTERPLPTPNKVSYMDRLLGWVYACFN